MGVGNGVRDSNAVSPAEGARGVGIPAKLAKVGRKGKEAFQVVD